MNKPAARAKKIKADFIVEFADHARLGAVAPVMVGDVEIDGDLSAENIVATMDDIVHQARKTAVTRAGLVVYEAYESDSRYLDDLDRVGMQFTPTSVRLHTAWCGVKKEYLVVGRDMTKDQVWHKTIKGHDAEDARLTAMWAQAVQHGVADNFFDYFAEIDIDMVVEDPMPKSEVAEALRGLLHQAEQAGLDNPAVDRAREVLDTLGIPHEEALAPKI